MASTNATIVPTLLSLTTHYIAPWQSLTNAGNVPSRVTKVICTALSSDGNNTQTSCESVREVWAVYSTTETHTTTSHVQLTTTVPGPGTLYIGTLQWTVQEWVTSLSLDTILELHVPSVTEKTLTSEETTRTVTSKSTRTVTATRTVTVARGYIK